MAIPMVLPFWVAIPVVALLIPITAIIADALKKIKEKEHRHQERLKAIEAGHVDAVALIAAPEAPKKQEEKPKGRGAAYHGAIWAGVGLGLLISTGVIRQGTSAMVEFANFLMIWAIPAFLVGVGLVIYGVLTRNENGTSS
jgi:hypothetical protein